MAATKALGSVLAHLRQGAVPAPVQPQAVGFTGIEPDQRHSIVSSIDPSQTFGVFASTVHKLMLTAVILGTASSDGRKHMEKCDGYDRMWDLLKLLLADWRAEGITDEDVFPALADFLVMNLLAAGQANGVSEIAVKAIIERMQNTLEDWRQGNPPFEKFNKKTI
ncbi:hypothetical protein [Novosphingobium beihaiensis]|uniref:Uncharacterized protein n=1 Tax=Novosphingobium beihaiensis TaxID=2930389 RepID=A0ABT0BS85_9SPHN|nr:hypothetical protein [Novosphingobium beihaiensis]MCJ2187886.1 hypothetical protein [Novosphingobium beihaiensis]